MAYRELFVVEVKEILRLWVRGYGLRRIARTTGLDRKTVRRYVTVARALGLERGREDLALDDFFVGEVVSSLLPGAKSAAGSMRNHCRAHSAAIEEWVKAGAKGPKVVRLLTRKTGVIVPLRTMQRFIHVELGAPSRRRTLWVADGDAGEELEIDFLLLGEFVDRETGKKRRMYALLCLAPFSRHQFVWPCLGQTQQDVIDGLEAAWRFFGGVFKVLLPDNMKPIVTRADPIAPVLNVHFTEYAQDRGFEIDPARPRKPRDKARVERQVRFVRDDYFSGEDFGSLREAREEAERWCRKRPECANMGRRTSNRLCALSAKNCRCSSLFRHNCTTSLDGPRRRSNATMSSASPPRCTRCRARSRTPSCASESTAPP